MTISGGGMDLEGKMKQTVTAKSDKSVTLSTEVSVAGKDFPAKEVKVDLTKPFDITSMMNMGPKKVKSKVEKDGDGKEKIAVGGKTYNTKWTKSKITTTIGGMDIVSEVKIWTAKNVPMTGMVKMELKSDKANVTMELTGSGSGS
jgi:hypothetical protein